MNFRNVTYQLGLLLLVLGALLGVICLITVVRLMLGMSTDPHATSAIAISAVFSTVAGGIMAFITRRRKKELHRRDSMLLVALSWIIGGLVSALPFYIWALELPFGAEPHPFQNFVNCYFEAISGLTTAGSSVLTEIEAMPWSLLFWRQLIQWIGGIGIVVLFVAVFPSLGVGAKRMFQFESSANPGAVMPAIRDTARMLLIIYVTLTAIEIAALTLAGVPLFAAVEHSFTTLATGGFSPRNASIGAYGSAAVDVIVTTFMVIGGINFTLYYAMMRGRFKDFLADRELRLFLILLAGSTLVIALTITGDTITTTTGQTVHADFGQALRYASFNLVSAQSTTGYATADYDQWPTLARAVMFTMILIGGCAGSTAGGLKVSRIIILAKILYSLIERAYRPQVIRPVKISGKPISPELQLDTLAFIIGTLVLLSLGTLLVLLFEPHGACDLVTAASANLATFCTTGPGFGRVGPVSNFGWMTDASKITLCAVMLLGRLELFAIIVLFSPRFWRGE